MVEVTQIKSQTPHCHHPDCVEEHTSVISDEWYEKQKANAIACGLPIPERITMQVTTKRPHYFTYRTEKLPDGRENYIFTELIYSGVNPETGLIEDLCAKHRNSWPRPKIDTTSKLSSDNTELELTSDQEAVIDFILGVKNEPRTTQISKK